MQKPEIQPKRATRNEAQFRVARFRWISRFCNGVSGGFIPVGAQSVFFWADQTLVAASGQPSRQRQNDSANGATGAHFVRCALVRVGVQWYFSSRNYYLRVDKYYDEHEVRRE